MYPLNEFPYTDYHTINLDYLMKNYQIITNDVANLKSRATALETRMSTAEGNITNLQGRMSTVEGYVSNLRGRMTTAESNISNLQSRMSTVEGYVSNLRGRMTTAENNIIRLDSALTTTNNYVSELLLNTKSWFIKYSSGTYKVYEGSGNGSEVTDYNNWFDKLMCNDDIYNANIVNDLYYFRSSDTIEKCTYRATKNGNTRTLTVTYMSMYNQRELTSETIVFNVTQNALTETKFISELANRLTTEFFSFVINASSTFDANTDSQTNTDYPYKVRVNTDSTLNVNSGCDIQVYFNTLKNMIDFSSIISDFVEVGTNYFELYFVRQLTGSEAMQLKYCVTGG